MRRYPDVIATQEGYLAVKRRGMGETVDIQGTIKSEMTQRIKDNVEIFKVNYLKLSQSKAMKDLLLFRMKHLADKWLDFANNIKATDPSVSDYLSIFNFKYEGALNPSAPLQGLVVNMHIGQLDKIANKLNGIASFAELVSDPVLGWGIGTDPRFDVVLKYKDKIVEFYKEIADLTKEYKQAYNDVGTRESSIIPFENALKEAISDAQKYIPNIPTFDQIRNRIDNNEPLLPELDPPPPPPQVPDLVAVQEQPVVIAEKPKSKLPLIIGAAIAGLTLLGKK